MANKETISYRLVRGALHLSDGSKIAGDGSTDDANVIRQLRELAEVKTPGGHAQYVVLGPPAEGGEINGGVIKPGEGTVKTAVTVSPTGEVSASQATVKYPEGISEADVQQVEKLLTEGGLTFEAANALSDEDIKAKTENIGPARIKVIRAMGIANGYPEYKAE